MKRRYPVGLGIAITFTVISGYYNLLPELYGLANAWGLFGWGIYIVFDGLRGRSAAREQARLYAEEKQRLEEKSARKKTLEHRLNQHDENDLLPVMKGWLDKPAGTLAPPLLAYSLLTASARFHPHGQSAIGRLSEPKHFKQTLLDETIEHLSKGYPDHWAKWSGLKTNVDSHLEGVVSMWNDIARNIEAKTKELGFNEYDGRSANYYEVSELVNSVWIDPEYFQAQGRHVWDDYVIRPAGEAWELFGFRVRSQKKEAVESLVSFLVDESGRVSTTKTILAKDKDLLETTGKSFQHFLDKVADDFTRGHERVLSSCSTCKRWLDELGPIGA